MDSVYIMICNNNEIYNVGSGEKLKFFDMVDTAKTLLNSKSNFVNIEPTPFHKIVQTKDMVLNIEKLKSLGFNIKYNNIDTLIQNLIG